MTDLNPAQDRAVRIALRAARERLELHAVADTLDPITAGKIRAVIGPKPSTATTS